MKVIKDWFTERDGVSWCLARAMGAAAFIELLYKFAIATGTPEFTAYGIAVSAIIAAVAFKNQSEK